MGAEDCGGTMYAALINCTVTMDESRIQDANSEAIACRLPSALLLLSGIEILGFDGVN